MFSSAVNMRVKVHPVVLFQISDAYERRSMENHRVIGTLVGEEKEGNTIRKSLAIKRVS